MHFLSTIYNMNRLETDDRVSFAPAECISYTFCLSMYAATDVNQCLKSAIMSLLVDSLQVSFH